MLARSLRPGAYVLIAAGERVPADGVVVQGEGSQDEALLSGESRPVSKQPGSLVIAGAINLDQTADGGAGKETGAKISLLKQNASQSAGDDTIFEAAAESTGCGGESELQCRRIHRGDENVRTVERD